MTPGNERPIKLTIINDGQTSRPRVKIQFCNSHGDSFEILPDAKFYRECAEVYQKLLEIEGK